MTVRHMLTTIDNPYDPFDDFQRWFHFDVSHGYNCSGLVDLYSSVTTDLTESIRAKDTERAIDRAVELNPLGIYRKVSKDVGPLD